MDANGVMLNLFASCDICGGRIFISSTIFRKYPFTVETRVSSAEEHFSHAINVNWFRHFTQLSSHAMPVISIPRRFSWAEELKETLNEATSEVKKNMFLIWINPFDCSSFRSSMKFMATFITAQTSNASGHIPLQALRKHPEWYWYWKYVRRNKEEWKKHAENVLLHSTMNAAWYRTILSIYKYVNYEQCAEVHWLSEI